MLEGECPEGYDSSISDKAAAFTLARLVMTSLDDRSGIADVSEILRLLPHRYPFLLIDRVVDICGDQHGIGIKNLTINEPFFASGNLVIPGVLVIEGMAQTAGVLALRALPPTDRRRIPFFMSIDRAKFRKPAGPGDTLEYHVDKLFHRRNIWRYRGEAKVGGTLVAETELSAYLVELAPTVGR
jgi:3-hydroxyacyl-[acyl-carrier-protein] dehydratase